MIHPYNLAKIALYKKYGTESYQMYRECKEKLRKRKPPPENLCASAQSMVGSLLRKKYYKEYRELVEQFKEENAKRTD